MIIKKAEAEVTKAVVEVTHPFGDDKACAGCGGARTSPGYKRYGRSVIIEGRSWPLCLACCEQSRGSGLWTSEYAARTIRDHKQKLLKKNYWHQRELFLKEEHLDRLPALLACVTLTHPDLDEVMNEPWPASSARPPVRKLLTFIHWLIWR